MSVPTGVLQMQSSVIYLPLPTKTRGTAGAALQIKMSGSNSML